MKKLFRNKKETTKTDPLIIQHNNMLNKINNDKNNLINLENKINNIKKINDNINNNNNENNNENKIFINNLNEYINSEKIDTLNNIKDNIETCNNELNYYSNSLNIIEKYYDINEIINYNKKGLNSFIFDDMNFETNNNYNKKSDINNIYWEDDNNIFNNQPINKSNIVKSYNNIINNKPLEKFYDYNICPYCHNNNTINNNDGLIICTNCGNVEKILVESELPNYKNNNIDKPIYPYKRLNHFMECLNQFQAKENINIPENIYNKIVNEFKSRRINDLSTISLNDTKYILKQLKLNKYYEHASFIYSKLSGNSPPHLTVDQERKLKLLFNRIDKSFNKFCPLDRRNFFNYNYLLHKLFQLIGLNQYLDYFPLLKSKEKLTKQDEIWKLVCKDLNIIYIPN